MTYIGQLWMIITTILLCLTSYHCFSIDPVERYVDEKRGFEDGLKDLFADCLGYTLIGLKPVSLGDCPSLRTQPQLKDKFIDFLLNTFKNSSRYILRVEMFCEDYFDVILIHKKAFYDLYCSKSEVASFINRTYGNLEQFFNAVEKSNRSFFSIINRDVKLLGLMLGFGAQNCKFYKRRIIVGSYLKKYPLFLLFPSTIFSGLILFHEREAKTPATLLVREDPPAFDSHRFRSLEEEWQWITDNEVKPEYAFPPLLFQLPVFIACKGDETEKIIQNFKRGREKIALLFTDKSFVEGVIEEASR